MATRPSAEPEQGSIAAVARYLQLWAADPVEGFCRVELVDEEAARRTAEKVRQALEAQGIRFSQIELPQADQPSEVALLLVEQLPALAPGVVSITGLAPAFPTTAARKQLLQALNFQRERLAVPGLRQIWWMPVYVAEEFAREIPDLDSWFQVKLSLRETIPREGVFEARELELVPPSPREARARLTEARARVEQAVRSGKLDPVSARTLLSAALSELLFSGAIVEAQEEEMDLRRQFPQVWASTEPAAPGSDHPNDHPNVARDLNKLARLLQDTNRLGEAEPLLRRVLAIDEASFGSDHPRVAVDLNNLAQLLQATNRFGEAEPLLRRALAIDEASFGSDHPRAAVHLNNLAQLLKVMNRLDEAEPLLRRALAIDEASFGSSHPNVVRDLENLAALLHATHRPGEAASLLRRALGIEPGGPAGKARRGGGLS